MRQARPLATPALALALTLVPLIASAGQAPSFLLKTINPARGIPAKVMLAEYVGPDALEDTSALVVYFFSLSDPGWQGDLEFLSYAFGKLTSKGMRAVAVLIDEGKPAANKAKAAARAAKVKFAVAQDRKRKVTNRYGVRKAPGIFVINGDGFITLNAVAFEEDLDEFLMSAIKKTMRGQRVDVDLGGAAVAAAPPPPPPPPPEPYYDEPLPSGDAGADEPLGREVTPAPSAPPPAPEPRTVAPAAPPPPPPPPPAPRETPEEKQLKLYMPLEAGNQWEFFHRPRATGDWHERIVVDITAGAHRDFSVSRIRTKYESPSPEKKKVNETWKLSPQGIAVSKGRFLLRTPIRPGTAVGPRASGPGTLKVADVGAKTTWSGRRLNRCVEIASGGASETNRDRYLFCPGVGLVEFTLYSAKLETPRTFKLVRYQVGGKRVEVRGYNEVIDAQVIREVRNGEQAKKILAEGRKLMDQGEYEKAMEEFAAVGELFPKRGFLDSNYWLGVAYLKVGLRKNNNGLLKQGAGALQAAVREDPNNGEAQLWLGNAYLLTGNQKAAKSAWRKVESPAEARKTARRALRNPRQTYDDLKPLALVEEGHEHRKKGNLDDAMGLYSAIIKEYPKNEEAHLGLGLVHYAQNNLKAALAEFQNVLEINDDNRLAMNYVNLVRMKLNR